MKYLHNTETCGTMRNKVYTRYVLIEMLTATKTRDPDVLIRIISLRRQLIFQHKYLA